MDETYLGSMLFTRNVSGTRVVKPGKTQKISGFEFDGYGSSTDAYPCAYMTAACSIGVTREEVDLFFARLDKTMAEFQKKRSKKLAKRAGGGKGGGVGKG